MSAQPGTGSRYARFARAAWILLIALLAVLAATAAWIARDPYRLVRLELTRQRLEARLERRALEVDEHEWVYAASDDAPAGAPILVLVHGFTGSKENWYPVARLLRDRYRLIVPDLPGWGESTRLDGADYGYRAQAARLAAFLRATTTPGDRVVLVGHSMGGGIVAVTAVQAPRQVDAVGLVDAAGVRFEDNAFGRAVLDGDNPFAVNDAASLQRYLDTVFGDPAAQPAIPWPAAGGYIAHRRAQAPFEQRVLDRIGRGKERFLPGELAARITQPVLLLWCRQDRVIDPSAMGLYARRIPQARQVLLDGCGHMAPVERPLDVAASLELLARETSP